MHTTITKKPETAQMRNALRSEYAADGNTPSKDWLLTHDDVNMNRENDDEEHVRKRRKLPNGNALCRPQLNGWYTMQALVDLLGADTAKSEASAAPTRWAGQGHGKPCIDQFLITDGEDAFKIYSEQFYVPPPGRPESA